MKWIKTQVFAPRPLVIVEDHMFHLQEILRVMSQDTAYWLAHTTLVSLDRPGPDTTQTIQSWLRTYPELQVATRLDESGLSLLERFPTRLMQMPDKLFDHQISFCNIIAALIRPGGFLVQDIQLSTLTFPAFRRVVGLHLFGQQHPRSISQTIAHVLVHVQQDGVFHQLWQRTHGSWI